VTRLEGKVVLISGGGRGIGEAIARAMVSEGAQVVIGQRDDAEGQALADELGPAAVFVHLDVTRPAEWESAVATAVATYGKLNVLVNNAGIVTFGPIDEYRRADWDVTIAVDLTGTFHGIQAAVPALKQAGGGSIVNMSSIAGLWGLHAVPGYVAAKFGVRGLTKAAALDLGKYGIRVNSVHPGFVHTAMTAKGPAKPGGVLGRGADPSEIASLVVFLASDESSFSTGSEFVADGGETAGDVATAPQPG
jgi:3alpha(or 20beta)-hydroxysteroid dehydrogenase